MTDKHQSGDVEQQNQATEDATSNDSSDAGKEASRQRFIRDTAMVTDGVVGGFLV